MLEDCIFCKITEGTSPAAKVYEDETVVAFLDQFPVSKYHTVIIPKPHYASLTEIPQDIFCHVMLVTQKIARVYRDSLHINDLQLLNNCGRNTQQSVFHFHVHLIPRFPNDGNNIMWQKHPEFQLEFPEMLKQLPKIE